jgi:putative DNA primase/helicase
VTAEAVLTEFRAAMRAHGLVPPDVIQADGLIHRTDVDAAGGQGDGSYLLHLDGVPAGGFQNWHSGSWISWTAKRVVPLSTAEKKQLHAAAEAARQQREKDTADRRALAAERAERIWAGAKPASDDHGYLQRKGIDAHGIRVYDGELSIGGIDVDGALVVPLRDTQLHIHSLQFITETGAKRFLPGGRTSGCYFGLKGTRDTIVVAEGFATVASIAQATGNAAAIAFDAGNLAKVAIALRGKYPNALIVIAADNDLGAERNVGVEAAQVAATAVNGLVAVPELDGHKCDFNDLRMARGDDAVKAAIDAAGQPPSPSPLPAPSPSSPGSPPATNRGGTQPLAGQTPESLQQAVGYWPAPTPLPDGLPPVAAFDYELLPEVLRDCVRDITDRMQCPPDFPAVAIMVVLASLAGRHFRIAPKRADDWSVVPNLWGMVVGRPGIMKSPPLSEIMRPLQVLQARAMEDFKCDRAVHQADRIVAEEGVRVAKDAIRGLLKKGEATAASTRAQETVAMERPEPVCRRYIVNDATVEKLGVILNENPSGVLLYRDELSGFFRTLERQGHEADRAFYLECWKGDDGFTYDRIGRGTLHIEAACISILGSIQPGPLSDLVRGMRGSGDDGLLQRFQLAVWPDTAREWRNIDRLPDRQAREAVQAILDRFDRLRSTTVGAAPAVPSLLRLCDRAQVLFDTWRESLEVRLRGGEEHPMLEAQLAKFRSLVPSLALLIHLTESNDDRVGLLALERAIAWAEYLESHANRIYAPAMSPDMDAARLLAKRIRTGDVGNRFSLRDIYNCGWGGLATRDEAAAAVAVLIDHDWLRVTEEPTPGRPRTVYELNPAVLDPEFQR